MPLPRVTLLFIASLALGCARHGPLPPRLTGAEVTPGVHGILALPGTPGPHPAVVILHGSFGWRPGYAQVARDFADSGYVALAVNYYAETGSRIRTGDEERIWHAWQATVANAVTYLSGRPEVSGRPIALIGYSRGAFLATSVAATLPAVGAVVDYYGGGSDGDALRPEPPPFPPLLILHGDADKDVSVTLAHRLYSRIHAAGGEVEMYIYPGAGHSFNAPWAGTYAPDEAADAWRRTIEFLRRRLEGAGAGAATVSSQQERTP